MALIFKPRAVIGPYEASRNRTRTPAENGTSWTLTMISKPGRRGGTNDDGGGKKSFRTAKKEKATRGRDFVFNPRPIVRSDIINYYWQRWGGGGAINLGPYIPYDTVFMAG